MSAGEPDAASANAPSIDGTTSYQSRPDSESRSEAYMGFPSSLDACSRNHRDA